MNTRENRIKLLYDIIGAPYFCSYNELKSYFRRKIKEYHPDISSKPDVSKTRQLISSFKILEKLYLSGEIELIRKEINSPNKNPSTTTKYSPTLRNKKSTFVKSIFSDRSRFILTLLFTITGVILFFTSNSIFVFLLGLSIVILILYVYRTI